ncbi:MAG: polysaccharide pyruvyl transferase family protein, partial [Candidatus Hodarchaeota archaeon]
GKNITFTLRCIYPLLIAMQLKIPYGFYAQSFGPFEFDISEGLVKMFYKTILSGSCFLYTRESNSINEVWNLLPKSKSNLGKILDSAFFLKGEDDRTATKILKKYDLKPNSFIILTIRLSKRGSYKKLEREIYSNYGRKLSSLIGKWIEKKRIPVAIVCQVRGDIVDSKFVYKLLPSKYKKFCKIITDQLSPEALKSLYKYARILMGMRFHSLVFSLSMNTPILGLYYYDLGPKIPGLMRDLEFHDYVFNIDNFSEIEVFKRLNELDDNRKIISKDIEQKITLMKKQSLNAIMKLREYVQV